MSAEFEVSARASALLAKAGYPTPPTATLAIEMLLNELGAARQIIECVRAEREHARHLVRALIATGYDRCIVKLGKPGQMHECGETCWYSSDTRAGRYSGWYHLNESITDHHAVPERLIR